MKDKFCLIYHEKFKEYGFGKDHPFGKERFDLLLKFLKKYFKKKPLFKPKPIKDKDLFLICEKEYISFNKKFFQRAKEGFLFDPNFSRFHSLDNLPTLGCGNLDLGARYILGGVKLAGKLIFEKKFQKVITFGGLHHSKRNFGEGFCIYNDVAFLAKFLIGKYRLERILILDTDAHAGNGTKEYFYREKKVLFIDIHQDPKTLYPGEGFIKEMGEGEGRGYTINIPLPPYAGDKCFRLVFEKIVEPVVLKFRPQIIIRNGGADPHFSDPLTSLSLTLSGFKMIGQKIRKLAEICGEREIDLFGSGYHKEIFPYSWLSLISGLLKKEIKFKKSTEKIKEKEKVIKETQMIIKEIKERFKKYWF